MTTWSLGSPAFAGQGTVSNGDHGRHAGQDGATTTARSGSHTTTATKARRHHHAPATTAHQAQQSGHTGDPSGNNGTVKIDRLGAMDRIPNNVPHPGCTFQVEWFGFDGGPDVQSTVAFAMQAPTRDVGLTVSGPSVVPVGGDAASGAGTSTGADAVQPYTLSFTGTPQAKQGYHVRLTVSTPRSRGNDTKTKVFWVEPCGAAAAPAAAAASTPAPTPVPEVAGTYAQAPSAPSADMGLSAALAGVSPAAVAERGAVSAESASAGSAAVPVAVDAGEQGSVLGRWSHSPYSLALTLAGVLMAGAAAALRLRRRA